MKTFIYVARILFLVHAGLSFGSEHQTRSCLTKSLSPDEARVRIAEFFKRSAGSDITLIQGSFFGAVIIPDPQNPTDSDAVSSKDVDIKMLISPQTGDDYFFEPYLCNLSLGNMRIKKISVYRESSQEESQVNDDDSVAHVSSRKRTFFAYR